MLAFWRGCRSTPGLGQWRLGTALIGGGVLGGALRGAIPDLLSSVGANVVGVVSLTAIWNGIRLFGGRPARWTGALLAAGGVAAFFVDQTYVVNDVHNRIIV